MVLFRELAFKTEKQNKQKVLVLTLGMATFQFDPETVDPLSENASWPEASPSPLLSPQTLPPLSGHHLTPSGHTASSCPPNAHSDELPLLDGLSKS